MHDPRKQKASSHENGFKVALECTFIRLRNTNADPSDRDTAIHTTLLSLIVSSESHEKTFMAFIRQPSHCECGEAAEAAMTVVE